MLGKGYGSPGNVHKVDKMLTKCSRGQKIERKEMTMNEGEGSSHAPLYGISRGFSETWGVRAEIYVGYVQSTCRVQVQYAQNVNEDMGPVSLDGGYNRRKFSGGTSLSPGEQLITSVHTLFPLYVPSKGINLNQSEPFHTQIFDSNQNPFSQVPNRFHSRLHACTEQFPIRMKIRAQSNNFRFEWKSEPLVVT